MNNKRIKIFLLTLLTSFTIICFIPVSANDIEQVQTKKTVLVESYISPVNELREKYNNEDIIAELKIDDIELDTAITQSSDNEYYLNHDISKHTSIFGNPYLDFRNEIPLDEEKQVNIYSHNFYSDKYDDYLPFSKLEKYTEENTFKNSNEIDLLTKDKIIKYEIYAVKIIKADNEHTILDASNEKKWQDHLDKLLSDTLYCKEDCHLKATEKILILQTCNYSPKDSFLLVIARKIK